MRYLIVLSFVATLVLLSTASYAKTEVKKVTIDRENQCMRILVCETDSKRAKCYHNWICKDARAGGN